MRGVVYWICLALIAVPALFHLVVWTLWFAGIAVPGMAFLPLLMAFSLVPPMLEPLVPRFALIALPYLAYLMLFLVLRRVWLAVARKKRVPHSFRGFQKVLGYIGVASFVAGVLGLSVSILIKAGSGVPAAMLFFPAFFCVPWAFFLTEVLSFREERIAPPPAGA